MIKALKRLLHRWRYRNSDTGQFISKAAYDVLPKAETEKERVK